MATPILMTQQNTGAMATGYQGFSWTCLFFGAFPALFRGHLIGFLVMLVLAICTLGFSGLIFMFSYNRWHYNWLVRKGYSPQFMAASSQANASSQNVINVHVGNNNVQEDEGQYVADPELAQIKSPSQQSSIAAPSAALPRMNEPKLFPNPSRG